MILDLSPSDRADDDAPCLQPSKAVHTVRDSHLDKIFDPTCLTRLLRHHSPLHVSIASLSPRVSHLPMTLLPAFCMRLPFLARIFHDSRA